MSVNLLPDPELHQIWPEWHWDIPTHVLNYLFQVAIRLKSKPLEGKLKRHLIPNTMTTNPLVNPTSRDPETQPANHYPYNDLIHRPPESQLRDSTHRRTSQLKPPHPLHIGIRLHIAKSTAALQRILLHLHEREREREIAPACCCSAHF